MAHDEHYLFEESKNGTVRIESGTPFVETIATAEALRDDVTHRDYKVGAKDARGNPIKMGAPFAYVDHYAEERFEKGQRKHPFNYKVYRLEDDETFAPDKVDESGKVVPDTNHPLWHKRWMKHGEFETPDEAREFAKTL